MATEYETDFYAWTIHQAERLKAGQAEGLDFANLAEEIETLGRSERHQIRNRLVVLIAHLLKWQHQPGRQGNSWRLTIKTQRIELFELFNENRSLAARVELLIEEAYPRAVLEAAKETNVDETAFPAECPWTAAQILDPGFYPEAGQ